MDPEDDDDRAMRAWPTRRAVVALLVILAVVAGAIGLRYVLTRPGDPEVLDGTTGGGTSAPTDAVAGGSEAEEGAEANGRGAEGTGEEDAGADSGAGEGETARGATEAPAEPAEVVVHVAGAVAAPGVVVLDGGARVADALAAAGGADAEADLSAINLARVVIDGEQVYVPARGEAPQAAVPEPPQQGAAPSPDGGAGPGGGQQAGGPVDINSADAETLQQLPGIGPALAQRIIAHREEVGPFGSVDELDDVSGIGPVLMGELRDLVVAG